MKEVWKDIPMYEGIYEVSTFGRVRSKVTGSITIGYPNHKGYLRAYIYLNGMMKKEFVHRLVAITFLPNPNNYPQVNHKDEDKTNNRVDNLEWCTCEYNNNYGTRSNHGVSVEVDGITFPSITKCAKYLGVPCGTLNGYLRGDHKMPEDLMNRNLSYARSG